MKVVHSHLRRIGSGILFLSIFVFYYTGITFFPHVHRYGHEILVHSHPYKKDCNGNPNHTHTNVEIILIAGLSNFTTTAIVLSALMGILSVVLYRNPYVHVANAVSLGNYKKLFNLRSPPAFSIL